MKEEVMQDPFLDELEKDLLKFLPQLSLGSDSSHHQNHAGLVEDGEVVLQCDMLNDFAGTFNAASMEEQSFDRCLTDYNKDETTLQESPLHLRNARSRAASTPEPKEILHLQLLNADLQNQLVNLSSLFRALEQKHNETLENLQRAETALLSMKRECFDLHVSNIQLLSAYYAPVPACESPHWPPPAEAAAVFTSLNAGCVNQLQKPAGPEESHGLSATYPALAKPHTGFSKFLQAPGSGGFVGQAIPAGQNVGMQGSTRHLAIDSRLFHAGHGCYKAADQSEMISIPAAPVQQAPFKGAPGTAGKVGTIHRQETPRSILSLQRVSNKKQYYVDHNSPGSSLCSSPTYSASDSLQYTTPAPGSCVDCMHPGGDARILVPPVVPVQRVPHFAVPRSIAVRSNVDVMFARRGPAASPLQVHSPPGEFLPPPSNRDERRAVGPNSTGPVDHGTSNGDIVEEAVLRLWDHVSDQGMYKTEICNKWLEVGWCSYGSRCQFAHGMEELRYVLRHPRYKTELCRMVAAGGKCSYAHRCHFRHTLTKEEKAKHFPETTDGC